MKNKLQLFLFISLSAVLLAACESQPRYRDSGYNDSRSNRQQCHNCGTIDDVQTVWVRDKASGGGAVLGAIIGGVLGNQVGGGSGKKAATVAGAVAGGVVGHNIEKSNDRDKRAYYFRIRLDDGRRAEVTQLDPKNLRVGDRVIIRDQKVYPY